MLALICRLCFGPHAAHNFNALTQHANAIFRLGKFVAVRTVFVFVPTSTNTPLKSSTRNNVDCRRDLGQQTWIAITIATDHLT